MSFGHCFSDLLFRLFDSTRAPPRLQNRCSRAGASSISENTDFPVRGCSKTVFSSLWTPGPSVGTPPGTYVRSTSAEILLLFRTLPGGRWDPPGPSFSTLPAFILDSPGLRSGSRASKSMLPCRRQLDFRKYSFCVTIPCADPSSYCSGNGFQKPCSHVGGSSISAEKKVRAPALGDFSEPHRTPESMLPCRRQLVLRNCRFCGTGPFKDPFS